MRVRRRTVWVTAAFLAVVVIAAGCGDKKNSSTAKSLVVAGANFSESSVLASIYADALEAKGYKITRRLSLGAREILEQAWASKEIDFTPEYVGSLIDQLQKGAYTPDAAANLVKLRSLLAATGRTALTPAPANDNNALVVTKTTADKYHLTKVSDLASVAGKLSIGAPAECFGKTRSLCADGYKAKYNIVFKTEKSIDSEASRKTALNAGDLDVALLFTGSLPIDPNIIVLTDDKGLQPPDNIVPVIRTSKLTDEVRTTLDAVSAQLTQAELVDLNKKVNDDKQDPADVAKAWAKEYGFSK